MSSRLVSILRVCPIAFTVVSFLTWVLKTHDHLKDHAVLLDAEPSLQPFAGFEWSYVGLLVPVD